MLQSIPPSGIEIFGSQLHTHLTGTMIYTKHVRDGTELPELNRDNHYSTHFQEIRLLHKPVRVLPVSHIPFCYNTRTFPLHITTHESLVNISKDI